MRPLVRNPAPPRRINRGFLFTSGNYPILWTTCIYSEMKEPS